MACLSQLQSIYFFLAKWYHLGVPLYQSVVLYWTKSWSMFWIAFKWAPSF